MRQLKISILYENPIYLDFYSNLLTSLKYKKFESLNLIDDNSLKNSTITSELIIIDISSKKLLLTINQLKLESTAKIILISPFNDKHITLDTIIKTNIYHMILKPFDQKQLIKIIQATLLQIKKDKVLKNKEVLLDELIERSPYKTAIYSKNGQFLYSNKAYLEACNFSLSTEHFEFNSIFSHDLSFKEIKNTLKTNALYTKEVYIAPKWYKSTFYFIDNNESVVHHLYEITNQKKDFDYLKKTSMFFEQSGEGVLITDQNGTILITNDTFSKITGYTRSESVGKSTNILASGIHEKSFYENLWSHLKYHGKWQGEIWNKRKNGEVYPEWLSITEIKDNNTGEINYMALFTDISSIKEADKKLHFYAKHDHLTGLLNRVQFENMLTYTIERANRNNKKFALMYVDLDYFKEVNDTYGHDIGDIMLKTVATRIRKALRKEDIIARVGGDEFNIILEDINDELDVITIASKLNDDIKNIITIDDKEFYMSLSIGIAIYPTHGHESLHLIKNADAAMYEVKKAGRNGFLLYNKSFTEKLIQKVSLQNRLKSAIASKTLQVFYQPVVDYKSHEVIGAEALIRWNDKKEGFISPDIFIPLAEKHGMIYDIGRFVIQKTFEDLIVLLRHASPDFKLSINVSSREFFSDEYIENLTAKINDFSINTKNLELEITETYVMQNHNEAIQKFELLKESGISIAIDDFGTGHSSLNYLKSFPIDKLKIDKSFILNILEDEDDKHIVETIINMSKIFGLKVQAEGVESSEHENVLKKLDCNYAQGYYYGKPMPLTDFIKELDN